MADITNLTNFLQDVADAIKEKKEYESTQKIAAEDFDTEILSIETGTDTSDATATANDLFAPKTAYSNGVKITGTNVVTYKTASELISFDYVIDETITNPIILMGGSDNKIVILGTNNNTNYIYLCTVSQTTQSIVIDKKVALTSVNTAFTSIPSRFACSLSSEYNLERDANLYLAYGSTIYLVLINFENLTVTYKASVAAGGTVKSMISNPVYINKCYYYTYDNSYSWYLKTATYNGTSLTKADNGQFNVWNGTR